MEYKEVNLKSIEIVLKSGLTEEEIKAIQDKIFEALSEEYNVINNTKNRTFYVGKP